jgi:integrase
MANNYGDGSVTRHGGGFRLRWSQDGKRRSKVVKGMTERQARAHLREIQAGLIPEPEPTTKRVRFDAFAAEYLAAREPLVAVGTYCNWVSLLRGPLKPFERLTLDQLDQRTVDLWWGRQGLHPVNRRNAWFLLRKLMRMAVRWGHLPSWNVVIDNAGRDVSTPRPDWTVADFDVVLAEVPDFYRAPIEVLFSGHLRLGELIALNGSDYRDGVVTVTKQRTAQGLTTGTKTDQVKSIKLLDRGVQALAARPGVIGSAPLFAGERAERITRQAIQKSWTKACAAAGRENFHLHDLRHVSLSLVAEVAPLKVVQQRAGHASPTSTQRYMHADKRQHAEAVEKVDELLRRIS